MIDSTNDVPPFFGPAHPVYPAVEQLVRIFAQVAPRLYRGFIQQCVVGTTPVFRDRETVLLTEANGGALGPGTYEARLMTSIADPATGANLPLFMTACCVTGALSSSSASSQSSSSSVTIWEGYFPATYFSHDHFGSDYFG